MRRAWGEKYLTKERELRTLEKSRSRALTAEEERSSKTKGASPELESGQE